MTYELETHEMRRILKSTIPSVHFIRHYAILHSVKALYLGCKFDGLEIISTVSNVGCTWLFTEQVLEISGSGQVTRLPVCSMWYVFSIVRKMTQ